MTQLAPPELVALVRQFTGDTWFHLHELARGVRPDERDQCMQLLFDELRVADEEKQTRIIDLMLTTDPEQAMSSLLRILPQAPSNQVKYHICWLGEGYADASWIPVLQQLVRTDPDPAARLAAMITLAFIGDPSVIPILQEVVEHDTGEVHGRRLRDIVAHDHPTCSALGRSLKTSTLTDSLPTARGRHGAWVMPARAEVRHSAWW